MQVNMEGVAVGIVALVMIGVFHPIVIKCEYYFSHKIWPLFLAAGIGFLLAALFTNGMLSMILGLAGVSCLWSIRELQEQARRVVRDGVPRLQTGKSLWTAPNNKR